MQHHVQPKSYTFHCVLGYLCGETKGQLFFTGQHQANASFVQALVVNEKIQYRIRSGDGSDHINQVIFHAIHGTHLDDISILPQISNSGSWKKRGEMSRTFTKRAAAPEVTHLHRLQGLIFLRWLRRCKQSAWEMLSQAPHQDHLSKERESEFSLRSS